MKKTLSLLLAIAMLLAMVPAVFAEDAAPVSGGILTVNNMEYSTFFLPFSSTTSDRYNAAPAIESLGRVNPETGITEGWLAEALEVDPDALTLTIKVRPNVKFSDGSDLNADAVIWNFDKMMEYGKATELGSAASYEKTDDMTIVMHFNEWANNWTDLIGEVRIYCPAAFEANGQDWAAVHAVGTGPFVMQEFAMDSHITYVKNENYWREGEPYLDGITIKFIADPITQTAAFMNNELDVLIAPSITAQEQLGPKYPNIAGLAPDLCGLTYMMFASGDETSPFHDLKVRLAVMHAIEWEDMAEVLGGSLGHPTPLFAVPGSWAYDDTVELYSYDLDEAKRLLTEAGYPNGFNTTITINDSSDAIRDASVLLQAYMSMIGINAEVKTLTSADFNAEKAEGTYNGGIMINSGASKKDFTANYVRLYSSEGVNYKNMMAKPADYEEALFGARAAKIQEEKETLLKKAARLLAHDYALVVSLCYTTPVAYGHDNVHDTGISETTSEAWTPNSAWKEAK
ncbi:MAG: ABC transporter substrate-binding protein [Clostridia bacterium]|nr:ABC transporter substrate-binding protein [Clostridia bacterium]